MFEGVEGKVQVVWSGVTRRPFSNTIHTSFRALRAEIIYSTTGIWAIQIGDTTTIHRSNNITRITKKGLAA
jgi:hypothetical protein